MEALFNRTFSNGGNILKSSPTKTVTRSCRMWTVGPGNVAIGTEELNFSLYLILANLNNLNSYV